MQAGIGAVDHVDVAAIIDLDIVGLYGELAAVGPIDLDAAWLRLRGDRWDEIRDLARVIRITNVDCAHAGIEMRDKQDAAVEIGVKFSFEEGGPDRPPPVEKTPPASGTVKPATP